MARGEPIWHTSSTGPDVDAQLERGRGHQGPEVAGPEPLLHDPPSGRRQAAVVGRHLQGGVDRVGDRSGPVGPAGPAEPAGLRGTLRALGPFDVHRVVGAEAQGQLVGDPFGHLAGVDEDQRGAVLEHVAGDAVEDVGELAPAGHRLELALGQLDGHVEVPPVAAVDDGRGPAGRVHPREQAGHHLEGSLGGREADALQPAPPGRHQMVEPLEGQGQMGPPLVAGQGVHLVDDDGVHAAEDGPGRRRRQQQVEGLRGGHQQVRGRPSHGGPLGGRRVAGPYRHREVGAGAAAAGGLLGDAASGTWRFSWTSVASARSGET